LHYLRELLLALHFASDELKHVIRHIVASVYFANFLKLLPGGFPVLPFDARLGSSNKLAGEASFDVLQHSRYIESKLLGGLVSLIRLLRQRALNNLI
jgi:hypothetical protein